MNTHELAWAAGFFDGEGTITCQWFNHNKYVRIQIYQKDIRPLKRFRKATIGVRSAIYGPNTSNCYVLTFTNLAALELFNLLKPYLSEPKIEQGEGAIQQYEEYREWLANLTNPQGLAKLAAD